jgi:phosphoglycolate phosphatase-like HAD superfamily hydrolase
VGRPFAPADVVVIGDTPHDVDCARAFGAVAVAVTTGQFTRDELLAERPDHLFDDLSNSDEVLRVILEG